MVHALNLRVAATVLAACAAVAACGGDAGTEGETRPFRREGRAGLVVVEGTETYRDGAWRKHGDFVFRDDLGDVIARGRYENGLEEGPWEQVYEDGASGRGSYAEGKRTGTWRTFHRSGSVQDVGAYDDGLRVGRWVSRRDDGTLLREAEYERGQLHGRVVWYGPDGSTIDYERSGVYRRGERAEPLPRAKR